MNSDVLIYAPQRQSPLQRNLYGTITLIAWAVYAYLVLPLVTLVLWAAGVRSAYLELWLPEAGIDPVMLVTLPLLALACAILLIGWAESNRARFRDHERRAHVDDVAGGHIAAALGVEPAMALALQDARVASLRMDDAAVLQEVRGVRPIDAGNRPGADLGDPAGRAAVPATT